jgi:hypothetical protein
MHITPHYPRERFHDPRIPDELARSLEAIATAQISPLLAGTRRTELEQLGYQFRDSFHCEAIPETAPDFICRY